MNSILIYCSKNSPRLRFILHLLLEDLLGINFQITQSKEEYDKCTNPKLNYGQPRCEADKVFIPADKLLNESGIREKNIHIGKWKNEIVLFHLDPESEIPFDIFSASFYLVSRYEEYLPHLLDQYQRFEAESSVAYTHKFLEKAIVNRWMMEFEKILIEKFPGLQPKKPGYSFISTIDIDNAFAFKQKGLMRTLGGYFRGLINLNWKNISDRTKTLLGKLPDPFDSYAFQLEMQKKYKLKVIYFFLLGDYGINDKNLPANNNNLKKLISHLSDYAQVGIHPSFGSNENKSRVKKEISRLAGIVHRDILNSRQHFSKLHFPGTYQTLLDNGILNDFSMGYHNHIGFRAGISTPYNWYNLETETETNLKIYPFVFSESTLKFTLKIKPENAFHSVKFILDEIRKTGGTFTSVFHNESLGDYGEWKGWKNFYEQIIQEATLSR